MICAATPDYASWIAALRNGVITGTPVTFTTDLKTGAMIQDMIAQRPVLVLADQERPWTAPQSNTPPFWPRLRGGAGRGAR